MGKQVGWSQTVTFQKTGAGAPTTLDITDCSWEESVEDVGVMGSTAGGVAQRLAGALDGGGSCEAVLNSAALPHAAAPGITAGAKGTLTVTTGSATPFTIPIMVTRLRYRFAMRGAYIYGFDVGLDSLTGAYTRST
jgi:RNA 3'-terminal phosphate cyclase